VVTGEETRVDLFCMGNQSSITVNASLTIIEVPDGCYAFCSLFKIPAKTTLTAKIDIYNRSTYLTAINPRYHDRMRELPLFQSLALPADLTLPEEMTIKANLPKLPPLIPKYLNQSLREVPIPKPWKPSTWLAMLVGTACILLIVIVTVVGCVFFVKHQKGLQLVRSAIGTFSAKDLMTPTPSARSSTRSVSWSAHDPEVVTFSTDSSASRIRTLRSIEATP
jgi:hypothetical protein